jgi:hypothetical protein
MISKENLLNFPENLKGEGHVTLALFVLAENRCPGGFSFWRKQNPAALGGEVEEGELRRGGGVGD